MYDINLANVKKERGFYGFLLFFGPVFFLACWVFIFVVWDDKLGYDGEVMSKRVEIEEHESADYGVVYRPTYYYEVKGKEYSCTTDTYSKSYPSEENRVILYNSEYPSFCFAEYDEPNKYVYIAVFVMPFISTIVGIVGFTKVNIRIKKIKKLNMDGKLVKGLPYTMEPSGLIVNSSKLFRPVVLYHLDGGDTVKLHGDARFDNLWKDRDGLVDLVIDENNPDNYFIDFEINRLGGNLPTDYSDNMGGIYNNYAGFGEQNEYEMTEQINDIYNSDDKSNL